MKSQAAEEAALPPRVGRARACPWVGGAVQLDSRSFLSVFVLSVSIGFPLWGAEN